MIEANRASSSANEVSMMTAVFGWRARISRVASIPLPSARRTSMTTTSVRAGRLPLERQQGLPGHAVGRSQLDVDLLAQATVVVEREPHLAEELLAPVFGFPGDPRKPHLRVCQESFLHFLVGEGEVEIVA